MTDIKINNFSKEDLKSVINEALKFHIDCLKDTVLNSQTDFSEFLTVHQTAEFFHVSKVTIYQWIKDGLLVSYKMGNRTYFKRSELIEQLLNSQKTVA